MKIGYRRVSSVDQNPERQLEGLALDKIFQDKVSGKSLDRPELKKAIEFCREGDELFVHSIDRLARNLTDLKSIIDLLTAKKVKVHFLTENLIFDGNQTALSTFLLHVMGAFAEFERSLIRERQREGIRIAKEKGKYPRKPRLADEQIKELLSLVDQGIPKQRIANKFSISRWMVYFYIKNSNTQASQ